MSRAPFLVLPRSERVTDLVSHTLVERRRVVLPPEVLRWRPNAIEASRARTERGFARSDGKIGTPGTGRSPTSQKGVDRDAFVVIDDDDAPLLELAMVR
jgi:hypothetical protein